MPLPYYTRETIDAKFDALKHELLAAISGSTGSLRSELKADIAELRIEIAGLRGEMKVWFLVMGTILAVLSSGVGNRILNLVWPSGPAGPAAVQQQR